MTLLLRINRLSFIVPILFIIFLSLISQTAGFRLQYLIAINGFSALEVVSAHKNPEGFLLDFPGGSRVTTSNSPITSLYPFAHDIGLDSLIFLYFMILLEIIVFLMGCFVYWRSLYENLLWSKPRNYKVFNSSFLVLSTIMLLSNSQMVNLGGFSAPFFHGQFYGFSDGLRLASIGYALENKWTKSLATAAFSFIIHPIKGALGAFVITVIFCSRLYKLFTRVNLFKWFLFFTTISTWSYNVLPRPRIRIDKEEFVSWTKVFQSHWYPIDLGIFTHLQFVYLIPFLCTVILIFAGLLDTENGIPFRKPLLFIFTSLLFITILGITISINPFSIFIVTFSLIRASELFLLIGIPLIVILCLKYFELGNLYMFVPFFYTLLILSLPTRMLFLNSLFGLFAYFFIVKRRMGVNRKYGITLMGILILLISLISSLLDKSFLKFIFGGLFSLICMLSLYFLLINKKSFLNKIFKVALTIAITSSAVLWTSNKVISDSRTLDLGGDYLQVQTWAKKNTDDNSLFMTDPCINYGWRDFSERASLGTPREWFMTGWAYSGDGEIFNRGSDIANTLGLYLDPVKLGPQSSSEVCELSRLAFYGEDFSNLALVSKKFGVDYFVLYRSEFQERVSVLPRYWQVAFQNRTFLVVQYVEKSFS